MSDKKITDGNEAAIEEEVAWLVKNYILDGQKCSAVQRKW